MAKEKKIGIYKITSPSGKIYIGQSVDIYNRFWNYNRLRCKEQKRLYNSLLKHGVDNHEFEIIHTLNTYDEKELDELEIYYINKFDTFQTKHGLNLKSGGNCGGRHCIETRKRMSEAKKGKKQSQEHINERTKNLKGTKKSPESIAKRMEIYNNKTQEEKNIVREKIEETKRLKREESKLNGTYVKYVPSEEMRKKFSLIHKGKKVSDETIMKRKETMNNKTKEELDAIASKIIETVKKKNEEKIKNGEPLISEETRDKLRKVNGGENNGMYGKKLSEESIKKSVETKKKNKKEKIANGTYIKPIYSEEYLKKQSERVSGENNPMFGKKMSAESIEKREATKKMIRQERLSMIF